MFRCSKYGEDTAHENGLICSKEGEDSAHKCAQVFKIG